DGGERPAQVVAGHHVGAATLGVGGDHLPVGQDQDEQQHHHPGGQGQGQPDRRRPGDDQNQQHLLGGIGGRGDRVGGEHGQRDPLGDPLVGELRGLERRAEQGPLGPVAERLVALLGVGGGVPPPPPGGVLRGAFAGLV